LRFRDRGIHARVSGPYFDYGLSRRSARSPCTSTTGPRIRCDSATSRGPMRSRRARDADLRAPTLPNDSLVWGGAQQMFIASFTCLALIDWLIEGQVMLDNRFLSNSV
jgi:hypothetical protein